MEIADGGEAKFGVRECGGTGCVDVLENKYTRNVQVVLRTRSDDSEPAAVTMRISLKARVCTPARVRAFTCCSGEFSSCERRISVASV